MVRRLILIIAVLALPALVMAAPPGGPAITIEESDQSPSLKGVTKIVVANGDLSISGKTATIATGGTPGQAITLDLGDDSGNDSVDLGEIATSGDTNNIFTEPSPDKLLIDLSNNWPGADSADQALTGDSATSFFSAGTLELARGGTGASLSDPNADRAIFWDDSAGAVTFLTIGTGLTLTDTTLTADAIAADDTAYNITTWNANTDAATKNALRDYFALFDTDGDGTVENVDAAYAGGSSIVTVGTIGTGTWQGTAIGGAYIDIANTTSETTIAADDLVIIYDTSATANRAMTRGNFITGIGAGQAITLDIGDDGGNDSTDLGEIATTGDTNSIITEPSADKMLIDMGNNWPASDLAVTLTITDNEATSETNAIIFTAGGALTGGNLGLESDGDLTYNPSTGTIAATEFSGGGAALTSVDAATGDSATSFFDAGTIEHEYGGLEADVSAYSGIIAVSGGATSEVDTLAELNTQIADATIGDTAGTTSISADWTWNDVTALIFGTDSDWNIEYDETTDDRLEFINIAGTSGDSSVYWDLNDSADSTYTITNSGTGEANLVLEGDMTLGSMIVDGGTSPGRIDIEEGDAGGGNFRGFTSPATLAQSLSYVLPDGNPTDNQFWLLAAAAGSESAMSYGTFSTDNFDVSAGTVTIKDAGVSIAELNATGTPSAGNFLRGDGSWQAVSASAGGSDTQVQYNDSGALAGEAAFTYNATANTLMIILNGSNEGIELGDGDHTPTNATSFYSEGSFEFDGSGWIDTNLTVGGDVTVTGTLSAGSTILGDLEAADGNNEYSMTPDDEDTDTLVLRARDVDGAAWDNVVTLTNANAPTLTIAADGGTTFDDAVTVTGTLTTNGAVTHNGNVTFGNADTDTATVRSLLIGGNSRAVQIASALASPTNATTADDLYVGGKIESGEGIFTEPGASAQYVQMYEVDSADDHYRRISVVDALGENLTFKLPTGDPSANDFFLLGGESADVSLMTYGSFGADLDVTAGTVSLADDSVGTAEMADADHGDVAWSTGAAEVQSLTITDNESTSETNAVLFTAGGDVDGGVNVPVESDGDLTYNPSTGSLAATIFTGGSVAAASADLEVGGTSDNVIIQLDGAPDSDDDYNGFVIRGKNAGENLSQFNLVRIANDTDPWHQADANAAGEFPAQGIVVAAANDTNEAIVLTHGVFRNTGWSLTAGGAIYLSSTAGAFSQTAPSNSGDCVQIVGWALSTDTIMFDFSRPYVEVQ